MTIAVTFSKELPFGAGVRPEPSELGAMWKACGVCLVTCVCWVGASQDLGTRRRMGRKIDFCTIYRKPREIEGYIKTQYPRT